jgi:predicted small lipoprotein YifL
LFSFTRHFPKGETAMRSTLRFALAAAALLLAVACGRTSPDALLPPSDAPAFDSAPADTTTSTSRGGGFMGTGL